DALVARHVHDDFLLDGPGPVPVRALRGGVHVLAEAQDHAALGRIHHVDAGGGPDGQHQQRDGAPVDAAARPAAAGALAPLAAAEQPGKLALPLLPGLLHLTGPGPRTAAPGIFFVVVLHDGV